MTDKEKQLLLQYPLNEFIEKVTEVEMKKSGSNYFCSCVYPDHNDSSPSFAVYYKGEEEGWRYKCHGCGKGGDIINFVRDYKDLGFGDAVKFICSVTGIKVSLKAPNKAHEEYKELMTNHAVRYMQHLYKSEGKVALDYLTKRGINLTTLKTFGIGYVPKDEYKVRKDLGWISDRISFPILENSYSVSIPKVIAMGYRSLEDIATNKKIERKYINDKNTKGELLGVFTKGENFFGFCQSYASIKEVNCAIIVEGYVDVLALHQSGIKNVLGNMTATLTKPMIQHLKRLCSNVVLFLDNDETGQRFTKSLIPELMNEGLSVKIFISPKGKDAADLCLDYNFDNGKIVSLIQGKSVNAINHLININTQRYIDIAVRERELALNNMMPFLETLPTPQKLLYENILMKRLDIFSDTQP